MNEIKADTDDWKPVSDALLAAAAAAARVNGAGLSPLCRWQRAPADRPNNNVVLSANPNHRLR